MATTDLMNALPISAVQFQPMWRQEFSRQAGGTPRVADIGPEVWSAKIQADFLDNDDAIDAAALVNALKGSRLTFYVWEPRRPYPRKDATGSILGASSVTISAIASGYDTITLAGLPAGYQISKGDKFSFDWGSSPTHRALHEFSADATADSFGVLSAVPVVPLIRVGAVTGAAVTLVKPTAEMMIMPGTYAFPSTGPTTSQISFEAIQVP